MKEINKHTLIEALASLKDYQPPAAVWDHLERELVLQNKVSELRDYEPPTEVWETINNGLVLSRAISNLPVYDPPTTIWNNLQRNLETPKSKPTAIIRQLGKWKQYAAAAAVIGLIALIGLGEWGKTTNAVSETLVFATETIDDQLLNRDWNEDEDAFVYLMSICKEKVLACENPEFKSLKFELEELNDAKNMLESAIGEYGTDPNLISQMREIEFARTNIVKQMIDVVI